MDVIFTHGAGLEVPKKTVMACRVPPDPTEPQADGIMELKECGTMTIDLLAWSDGLAEAGITPVAMDSTGAYWKPVYHRVEGDVTVFLVHAAPVTQGPGRKTAKAEARWLATLLRQGLWPARCIPPVEQRDWRDLTRDRTKVVQERSREVNRVHGVLERANSTRGSVAPDIMGLSGRAILAALVEGRADPATMAAWAHGRMRRKIPLLEQALSGLVREHHRQLLALQLAHIDFLDEQIDTLSVARMRCLTDRGAGEPPPPRGRQPARPSTRRTWARPPRL